MHQFSEHTKWQAQLYNTTAPLSPFEDQMRLIGYNKVLRPKDLAIKQYLQKYASKEKKLLDMGCAAGVFTQRFSSTFGIQCTGIDVSEVLINKAKEKDPHNTYLVADASHLPFEDNSFDIVTSFDNLEHIKEYKDVIKEMVRVLKPDGIIILNTINKNNRYTFDWLLEKFGSTYHLERAGHVKELFFEPNEIKSLFTAAGLNNVQLRLFDATFVLIADCLLYIYLLAMERISTLLNSPKFMSEITVNSTDTLSKIALPFLERCDTVFTRRGFSNAFFLIGNKEGK